MATSIEELLAFRSDHLAWPAPPKLLEQFPLEEAEAYLKRRKTRIIESEIDPLSHGYVPSIWNVVEEHIADIRAKYPSGVIKLVVIGGNRSSKTRFASNYVLRQIVSKDASRWWCCDSTEAQSRANQMRLLMEQFPPVWRNLDRDEVVDVRYTLSDGFPKNIFITPNKSEVSFKFYSMDIGNLPGPELDGIWCFIAGTSIPTRSGQMNIERLRISDYVQTRFGYRKVRAIGKRRAKVGRVRFSNGSELVGTAEHPILTTAYGWMKLSELRYGHNVCAVNALHGKGRTGTPMVEDITSEEARRNRTSAKHCIGRFGKKSLETFLKDFIYTIRTGIDLITRSIIWNVFLVPTTCTYTSPKEEPFPRDGVKQSRSKPDARFAGLFSKGNFRQRFRNVKRAVIGKQKIAEKQNARACDAGINLSVAEETSVVSVVSTWEDAGEADVFNLRVDGEREYIANGIVVHNCDELVPLDWVNTLKFRLVNRNGIMIITFTPELGWNETYGYFFEGAQILEEIEAELCPRYNEDGILIGHRKVPRIMQCQDPLARIIFFHTSDNPFSNYEGLKQELKDKSEDGNDGILIRAYGVCERGTTAAFRMFNRAAHVITEAQFRVFVNAKGPRWHLVDPCDGRNWFMIWVYCPSPDKWIIYREWPSYGHTKAYIEGVGMPGPWTLTGEAADGVKGPGQATLGFSLERYKEEIEHKEGGEKVFARYIDSRYATSPRTGAAAVTNLQEQLAEVGMEFCTMVPGKGRIIGAENNDGSIDMINSALWYDAETELGKFSAKYARLNVPQLQVVETCPNTIYALEHWTGQDGQKGACKDPIDCIRGLFLSQVNFVDGTLNNWVGGGIPR